MSIAAARLARPIGVVFIVVLAVFVALSVAGAALLLGVMPAHLAQQKLELRFRVIRRQHLLDGAGR